MDTGISFAKLGLSSEILKAIKDSGYTNPTPVQQEAIPELMAGRDVFASADTGTGKTAAFMLPALEKLTKPSELPGKGPRILVLTPTRELATQITNAAKQYGRFLPRIKTVSILGGMPYEPQRRDLKHYVDILIATPGRLLDHTREEKVDYSRVEMFVLDEADRMLDMGFLEDVEQIASYLPAARQTVLFSATLKRVSKLAKQITKDPKTIEIAQSINTNDNVKQHVIFADDENHKRRLLKEILNRDNLTQGIVFSATKAHTEVIAEDLERDGMSATAIHGDLRQRSREAIIRKLRSNRVQVLVATDVAARGIDIPGLSHVINYDIPRTAEDYTHRIGRTGRAGLTGMAITFVSRTERHKLRFIEKDLGHPIEVIEIPGFEAKPVQERPFNQRGGSRHSDRNRGGRSGGGGGQSRDRGRFGGGQSRGNSRGERSDRTDSPRREFNPSARPQRDGGRPENTRSDAPRGRSSDAPRGRTGDAPRGPSRNNDSRPDTRSESRRDSRPSNTGNSSGPKKPFSRERDRNSSTSGGSKPAGSGGGSRNNRNKSRGGSSSRFTR
jgi:superfamily II DNA/RNA helicase